MRIAWHRPPPLPSFALRDAHRNLFTNQVEDKRELLNELVGHLEAPSLGQEVYDEACPPVLILWGAYDRVFPVHLAHRMHRALQGKQGTLEVFARAAYAPNLERPRRFNNAVLRFWLSWEETMVTPQRLLFPNRVRVYDPEEVTRIAQDECSEQSVGLSLGTKEAIWKSVINFYKTGLQPSIALCIRYKGLALYGSCPRSYSRECTG